MTTVQTFDMVGIREDLSDIITNIAPTETPIYSSGRKGVTGNNGPEWLTDSLQAADAQNKTVQGADVTSDTMLQPLRLRNWVQLFDKVVQVSTSGQAVDTAGRASELKYQVAKSGKEIKRDIEERAAGNYPSVIPAAGTEGEFAGLAAWPNNDGAGAGGWVADGYDPNFINSTSPGYNAGTQLVTAATPGVNADPVEETHLKPLIKALWQRGADPSMIVVNATLKQDISTNFGGIATQYKENTGRSLSRAVILGAADWYVSDFGEHRIVPDRFADDTIILVVDPRMYEFKFLQPFRTVEIAKLGHSDRRLLSAELTLCVKDPNAIGMAAGMVPA